MPATNEKPMTGGSLSEAPGSAPSLCPDCEKIVKESNLVWSRVGGLCVGDYRQPITWQLRDKYTSDIMSARAKEIQRLTGAIRYLHAALPHLPDELKASVSRFLSLPNT